jgi:beta-lactamase regulating signal transducer with metallopeptidase domain
LAIAWCIVVGAIADGDPMLIVEAVVGSVILLWMLQVIRELLPLWRLAETLATEAVAIVIGGIGCRITPALGADAVVVGAIRPRIYVGADLVDRLTNDEIEAVLYHEEHHRLTRAPLRAAAISSWLRLFGRADRIRQLLLDRLADLETMADAEALRRGSTAGSLARALLKGGEPIGLTAAFSYAADRRVEQLLDHVDGDAPAGSRRLPYEWLPIAMFAVTAIGCHIGL